ncbi:MAG: pyridoxal phosphate-dependent aminotransferase [Anaerolineae bacterium]|nr:pyridoxal phosphate-dependent aminotransferase [Anaerolineae bacterium]
MPLSNKTTLLQRHQENILLNAPTPAIMMRNPKDVGADELFALLDERVITSASEALEAGQTHYADVPGIAPLRESLTKYLNAATHTRYNKANILVTAGMQEARFLTIQMIGELFGRIAVPSVVHPGVKNALGVREMTVDMLVGDYLHGGLSTIDSLKAVLEAGCRLLYLESPSRLTGAMFKPELLVGLAELLTAFDAFVIWDQGLAPWVVDQTYASLSSQTGLAERIAVIGELYPGMGLASWFIGYIAAPEEWLQSMQSQKQIMAICTSTASQYAALEAGKLFDDTHPKYAQRLSQSRQKLVSLATDAHLEVIPGQAAIVLALRLPPTRKAKALDVLQKAGYTVADGTLFGAPDVIRITVTATPAAEEALKQIAQAF